MLKIQKIASHLCGDLVAEVVNDSHPCIITSLYYPNGDSINLYFEKVGRKLKVSDKGTTLDNLSRAGIDLTDERKKVVELISRQEGISIESGQFAKTIQLSSAGEDCLRFCQTLSQVSGLHYQHGPHIRSQIPREVENLLKKMVQRPFEKNWHDSDNDPSGAFPVDYHLNGSLPGRNLFYVTSDGKALLVAAVVHFLKSNGIDLPTMSVVDPHADIKALQIERLQFSSTDMKFGVKGNEDAIVKFASGKPTRAAKRKASTN